MACYVPQRLQFRSQEALDEFLNRHDCHEDHDPTLKETAEDILAIDFFYNCLEEKETGIGRRGLSDLVEDIAQKLIQVQATWGSKVDIDRIFKALRLAYTHSGPYETIEAFGLQNLTIYGR